MIFGVSRGVERAATWGAAALAAFAAVLGVACADEGGASYWVPGSFGSMAAVPTSPGWSVTAIHYYSNTHQPGAATLTQDPVIGVLPPNVTAAPFAKQYNQSYQDYITPAYTFQDPVLGGQLALNVTAQVGLSHATLNGAWFGVAATPSGNAPFAQFGARDETLSGLGDIVPEATLKWAFGVHNFLAYAGFNMPTGQFSPNRLPNIGVGHWATDGGGGYTYFDQKTGWEFSGVLGITYNFVDPQSKYQDGVDMHFDWASSYTFNDKFSAGVVGYVFRQLSCDSAPGDMAGCFESQVFGVGPQFSYNFPVNDWQGSLNFKAYKEFWTQNRPEGWNGWITLTINPPAPPSRS